MDQKYISIFLSFLAIFTRDIVKGQDININATHVCSSHIDNQLKFEINIIDSNTLATGIKALNASDDEIETCVFAGLGTASSPFRVVSYVNLTSDLETNGCGLRMSTISNEVFYSWHLRAYRAQDTSNTQIRGFIINATCSKTDITDGEVQTLVGLNVPSLTVSARYAANATGENSFATNSDLLATLVVYPNGQNVEPVLQNAKGLSLRNCFSGTDPGVQENRQLFLDSSGCPLTGTNIELSEQPQKRPGTGISPIIVDARYFQARNISGSNIVYIECAIFKCTVENDPGCINSCNATSNNLASPSAVDTNLRFRTSFIVQDQPVQSLFAATVTDQGTSIQNVTAGTPIVIISKHTPNGVGTNVSSLIRNAVGFYVYNCRYEDLNNLGIVTQIINDIGCPIGNTALSPLTGFVFQSSTNGVYTIQSGPIIPTVSSYRRYRVRCDTGVCTRAGHNFCVNQRCNQQNNDLGGAQKIGYQGLEFLISVYNTTSQPVVSIEVEDSDGRTVGQQQTVVAGTPLDLSVTVTPTPEQFPNIKGIFLYNAYATNNPADIGTDRASLFIDENGCRVADSPYATSQNCLMDNSIPGVPPFTTNCGDFVLTAIQNATLTYSIGVCYEENDPKCLDPCAHGPLVAGDTAEATGTTVSRLIQVVAVDDRRTAVRSSEIQTTIIAVTVVAPIIVLGAVAVITYFVVNSQRPKNSIGNRSVNGYTS